MNTEEWLTRGTIWLALVLYVAAEAAGASRRDQRRLRAARWLLTWGGAAFLVHVACAFQFYHHWSHAAAYAATAQRTLALTGWNSGAGLYLNYLFGVVWLVEVFWSWATDSTWRERPRWITWSVRGFFLFMMVNGAVVFVRGPARWLGVALCLALAVCWWKQGTGRRCLNS